MSLIESSPVTLGEKAPDFALYGVDGRRWLLDDFSDAKVLAVVFMCNHCPYVQASIERINILSDNFADKGVQFVGINSNDAEGYPEDGFEAMKVFAEEHEISFPYLVDESQRVASNYKAVCTPDIFVYDSERKLRYHGRIDNNWKDPSKVTSQELRDALQAMVSGRPVSTEQEPSMGCSIKWKQD